MCLKCARAHNQIYGKWHETTEAALSDIFIEANCNGGKKTTNIKLKDGMWLYLHRAGMTVTHSEAPACWCKNNLPNIAQWVHVYTCIHSTLFIQVILIEPHAWDNDIWLSQVLVLEWEWIQLLFLASDLCVGVSVPICEEHKCVK